MPYQKLLSMFHRHILDRTAEFNLDPPEDLPSLSSLMASREKETWFPVNGMYGGFSYALGGTGKAPILDVSSWSRVLDGSGKHCRLSADAIVLVDEGFV